MNLRKTLMFSLLCALAVLPARADEHDDDDGEEREVEVIKIDRAREGGPGKWAKKGGDDDEARGGRGPRGGPMGGMKRIMISKEHMGERDIDPAHKEKHEKLRDTQDKVRVIAKKLRVAKDSEKAALKKEAKAVVTELFDARMAMEKIKLEKMTEHLADRKARLEKRVASRDRLIEEKVDQLAGDASSWDD